MRVSVIQLGITDGRSKAGTTAHALGLIDSVGEADLVLLPEIWNVGFFSFDEYHSEAETLDGPTVMAFREKAAQRSTHIHMGSFVEKGEGGFFNTSVLIGPAGEVLATYRKVHLFGFESKEHQVLTPGKGITVVSTDIGRFGLATCYDLRFPEQFRIMMKQGVQVFLIASAWPSPRIAHWRLFNRSRALENLCFNVACNCAGTNHGSEFGGNSMVVNPLGEVVASLQEKPGVLSQEIDLEEVDETRKKFPFVGDMVDLDAGEYSCGSGV
ncbi:MAG: carbon-nitrogen family hydrolase [Synergistales bacterium]|jgi:predicted amidohydrolase|nr:carbon-nitrogen family hydrolase [Synergistales bacterium]MDD5515516.1 carbon-nitrogen family hydrolase [Synergistales bacterium]MDI9393278.1 carbon-nitrogen family hydrolase [Synergistota bacterium]